jgi:hypothetical protein
MAVDLNVMATNIKNILAGVEGINAAFDYEPQDMPQLPATTLYFDGFTGEEQTMGSILYGWKWFIRLYIPINSTDISIPQTTLRTLVTNTLKTLRGNVSLNEQCLYNTVYTGDVSVIASQSNAMLMSELTLIAYTQEPR